MGRAEITDLDICDLLVVIVEVVLCQGMIPNRGRLNIEGVIISRSDPHPRLPIISLRKVSYHLFNSTNLTGYIGYLYRAQTGGIVG